MSDETPEEGMVYDIDTLRSIAKQNYLSIKKIESHQIGEEQYEQLLYESMYAKDNCTHHMMKENEFDIILNSCKKRQDFMKQVEQLMKN